MFLLARVEHLLCAFLTAHVEETLRPLPVAVLPGVAAFVLGSAVVRGEVVPVVEVARLLGLEPTRAAQRWLLVRAGTRRAVLAVSEVLGLRPDDAVAPGELPPLLGAAHDGGGAFERLGQLDGELLGVLSTAALLPDAVWAALGAEA